MPDVAPKVEAAVPVAGPVVIPPGIAEPARRGSALVIWTKCGVAQGQGGGGEGGGTPARVNVRDRASVRVRRCCRALQPRSRRANCFTALMRALMCVRARVDGTRGCECGRA